MSGQEESGLAVTVIAVTHFAHGPDGASNEKIGQEIDAEAEHVRTFFEKNFNVPVRVFKSDKQTTSEAIRSFLYKDLPSDTREVQLLFVLSHGMARSYPNSPSNTELFIASSNTDSATPEANAIQGNELLSAVGHLQNATSAFLFIDTCNAGAIGGFAAKLANAAVDQASLSRTMVLASSLEDQFSYKARFTEALLRVWSTPSPQCSATPKDIANTLAMAIKKIDPTICSTAQDVSLAIRYATERDFCVESFTSGQALLILTNPTYNTLWAQFVPDDSANGQVQVPARGVAPVLLARKPYKVIVRNSSGPNGTANLVSEASLDFSKQYVQTRPLDSISASDSEPNALLAAAYKNSASLIESWNHSDPVSVKLLREKAKSAYMVEIGEAHQKLATQSVDVARTRQELDIARVKLNQDTQSVNKSTEMMAANATEARGKSIGSIASLTSESSTSTPESSTSRIDDSAKTAITARTTLDHSLASVGEKEQSLVAQEERLTQTQLLIGEDQKALSDLSLAIEKARIVEVRKRSIADSVSKDLAAVGDVKQTSRGASLSVRVIGRKDLKKIAEIISKDNSIALELEYTVTGNAKSSAEYQAGAEKQLKEIKDQLLKLGLPAARLAVRGFGLQGESGKEYHLVFSPSQS
jgi:hypothetical protein